MKELFLIRGCPGSGKSSLAKSIGGVHYEADMFFINPETGVYEFVPSNIKHAHEWCKVNVRYEMAHDTERIVISNTFTQEWEMMEYNEMAEYFGYRVYSLICENRHGGINEHGVPEDKLEIMKNRFEVKL
jgi:ABC-type molybdenum transport system ATPase subunit/photorepair protein PhrA